MSVQIQLRRGTAALWSAANPVLAEGEAGVETDTWNVKYGDGVTAWNALGYRGVTDAERIAWSAKLATDDIGVTVQPYDAHTAKTDVANAFTASQSITVSTGDALRITNTGTGNSLVIEDSVSPDSTPVVVTADGQLIIGATSGSLGTSNQIESHQVVGAGAAQSSTGLYSVSNTFTANVRQYRARLASAAVVAEDGMGTNAWFGWDGTSYKNAAAMSASVDGTVALNSIPSRITLNTTPVGGTGSVERVRIDSLGQVTIYSGKLGPSITQQHTLPAVTSDTCTLNNAVQTLSNKSLATESLPVIVNNYPASPPSLNLDFANSQTIDPRMSFARASAGTRVNERGLIESTPANYPRLDYDAATLECKGLLFEEARVNLLDCSEHLDDLRVWGGSNRTVNTGILAPDGTLTAVSVAVTAAGTIAHYKSLSITVSTTYTVSVYFKPGSAADVNVSLSDNVDSGCNVSVNTGSLVLSPDAFGGWAYVSGSVTPAAGGWYRIVYTCTSNTSDTLTFMYACPASGSAAGKNVYFWGAQVEAGAFATSYMPSVDTHTGRASSASYFNSAGLLAMASSGAARLSYTPSNLALPPKLLVEDISTNLVPDSEVLTTSLGVTVTANAAVAPDGASTADLMTETATTSEHYALSFTMTPSLGQMYTWSFFAKPAVGTDKYIHCRVAGVSAVAEMSYRPSDKTTFTAGSVVTSGVQELANGWVRIWVSVVATGTSTLVARVQFHTGSGNSYLGTTNSFYIWGRQLEAGPLTSYIPTTGSAVTRVADTYTRAQNSRAADSANFTGENFSKWYRQDEGTFVVSGDTVTTSGLRLFLSAQTAGGGDRHQILAFSPCASTVIGGVPQLSIGTNTAQTVKVAYAYKTNSLAVAVNGAAPIGGACGVPTNLTYMTVGKYDFGSGDVLNGHIKSLAYYPKRLTNVQVQALSTL